MKNNLIKRLPFLLSFAIVFVSLSFIKIQVNAASWLWPVNGGKLGCTFNCTFPPHNGSHSGIDINGVASGTPVLAAYSGTVSCVNNYQSAAGDKCPNCSAKGAGYHVEISHGNNLYSGYYHLSGTNVTKGSHVSQGQVIGYVGNTGNSYGEHLHFCVSYATGGHLWWSCTLKNPLDYVSPNTVSAITITNRAVTEIGDNVAKISASLSPTSYVTTCGFYIGTSINELTKISETVNVKVNSIWYNLGIKWFQLNKGTTYYYKMFAIINGVEYQSAVESFTTTGYITPIPSAASISISKIAIPTDQNVTFNFKANNASGYTIGIDKGNTRIDTTVCGGTAYYTRSFSEPGNYSAYVTAYNTAGYADSERVYFTVVKLPGSPPGIKASSASYNSINISWNKVPGANGYTVYRATSENGAYSSVASTQNIGYTNGSLKTNTTYYYKVAAYCKAGNTTFYGKCSSVVYAKPVPSAPTNPIASSVSYNSISIKWTAVSGATKYEVRRSSSSKGTYSLIADVSTNSYCNTGLKTGNSYFYKVRAYRLVGSKKVYSNFSSVLSAKPVPGTPSTSAKRLSSTGIKINWKVVKGTTKYEIYRATSSTGYFSLLTKTSSISYKNTGLKTKKTYYYKVRAYTLARSTKVYGNFSKVVSATT